MKYLAIVAAITSLMLALDDLRRGDVTHAMALFGGGIAWGLLAYHDRRIWE